MIIFHLPWQLLKDFFGQLDSVIVVTRELYELDEVSECSVALCVGHLAVIIV